ncbi:MAG TPA: sigma-70 family RNA polymerase sigma factor [Bacteroidales bacterium]|nr:sigma-70 family RNA polymerase sigma factor [Bacteroidales bacterium]
MTDPELLDLYQSKKDLEALGALYKRYMILVYGLCMKYLKNRQDAQDAVMQIFETLVKDALRFEIRSFKSWLYGVSRNHCLMKLRYEKAENNRLDKFSADFFMEINDDMHPVEKADDPDVQVHLKDCMENLKKEQRLCVELFYYQQRCYKEIADELSFNENQVKSNIQNGKRNLKICLESKNQLKNVRENSDI